MTGPRMIVAAAMLLAVGCSDDGDSAGVPTTSTTSTTSTSTTTTTTTTTTTATTLPPLTADEAAASYKAEMERACRAEASPMWDPRWAASGKTEADLHADVENCILWTMANEYAAAIESACAVDSGPVTFDPSWSRTKFTQEGMAAEVEACRAQRRAATSPPPRSDLPASNDPYDLTTHVAELFWDDLDQESRLEYCGFILNGGGISWTISRIRSYANFEVDRDALVDFFDSACARAIREVGE